MNPLIDMDVERKRQEIMAALFQEKKNSVLSIGLEPNYQKFPELVLLNQNSNQRPIFWFHSVGSVQPYFELAKTIDRPFFGIEARGLRTDRAPLCGIDALAAYYVHIITSVQNQGRYDLGGYSLGGLIAYEVARQLQELGEAISSLVMIDTLDSSIAACTRNISYKSRLLQGVNHTLASSVIQNPQRKQEILIDRKEINWSMDEEKILQNLVELALARGAPYSKSEMQKRILRMAELQDAYGYERYTIRPLKKPAELKCIFFRNKEGILFGDMSPFFWVEEDEAEVDHLVYWKLWQENLPKMRIIDVDSTTHMTMLNEEKAYKPIFKFCKKFYIGRNT